MMSSQYAQFINKVKGCKSSQYQFMFINLAEGRIMVISKPNSVCSLVFWICTVCPYERYESVSSYPPAIG